MQQVSVLGCQSSKLARPSAKILSHRGIWLRLLNNASDKNLSLLKNIQASHQTPICIVTAEVQETKPGRQQCRDAAESQ
jgi:hypothetical protein